MATKHNIRRRRTGVALAALFAAGLGPCATAHADVIDESLGDAILGSVSTALESAGTSAGVDAVSALHDQLEAAITAPDMQQLLDAINFPTVELFGRDLIGNGINVGDPIGALPGETFNGTNEGLLTPELSALGINPGDLHDGGFLFGDNASTTGSAGADPGASTAQGENTITCNTAIIAPTLSGVPVAGFGRSSFLPIIAPAVGACDGPAGIGMYSEISWDGIPIGIPGLTYGIGSADTTASTLFCIPGNYTATLLSLFIFPPGYIPLTPTEGLDVSGPVDITAC